MSASASILHAAAPHRSITRREGHRLARSLFRVHERIMSRPTLRLLEKLQASQWWPRERFAAYQSDRLRELLQHSIDHCPFYKARRSRFTPGSEIAELPLLTRSMLRQSHEEMRSRHDALPLIGHTHGTADEGVRFYWDRMRQARDKAHRLRGHAWHGFEIGDRELHLWPIDPPASTGAAIKQALRHARDRITGDRQIDILDSPSMGLAVLQREWSAFKPARVTAYPSVLAEILKVGLCPSPVVRTAFLTGEVTFGWQRQLIERALGAPIIQNYGLQEVGPIAFECREGSWHTCAESVIVEFIRDGRTALPGELAEVVVTGLQSRVMPMIRYCTGDIVRVAAPRNCPCGRGLPVMPPILGRAGDFVLGSNGRWIGPDEVTECVGRWIEPGTFQFSQSATGDLAIGITAGAHMTSESRSGLEISVRELIGGTPNLQIVPINSPSRTRFGKCRYVQSARTTGGLACTHGSEVVCAEI
ncbi:MAG TPA: hypothetical protein VMV81_08390 [Phycisphaerae bacterium]|nr:hypothetical protein [Phycisphaerae bacterium]